MLNGILNGTRIEEMVFVIIVGRCSDNDQIGRLVCSILIHSGGKIEFSFPLKGLAEEALNLIVLDGADELVKFVRLGGRSSNCSDFVMLCQQHGQ